MYNFFFSCSDVFFASQVSYKCLGLLQDGVHVGSVCWAVTPSLSTLETAFVIAGCPVPDLETFCFPREENSGVYPAAVSQGELLQPGATNP